MKGNDMTQEHEGYYEVSAYWLKATGRGDGSKGKAFPVVRSYMAGNLPIVVIALDNGSEWELIASWRGRYVGKPEPDSSWQPADDLIDATECMSTDEYIAHLETEA
jgi:hypothetical protein